MEKKMSTLESSLNIVFERFCRVFRTTLSGGLRKAVDLRVRSTESIEYGEFLKTLPVPASLNLFRMNPLSGQGIMVLETRLIFNLVDIMYGGTGELEVKAEGRDFTAIEQKLVKRVAISALEDLQYAWRPVFPVQASYVRTEINKMFTAIVPNDEVVIVATFDVELTNNGPTTLTICIPYSMISPLLYFFKVSEILRTPEVEELKSALTIAYQKSPLPALVQKAFSRTKGTAPENSPANGGVPSKTLPPEKPPLDGLKHLAPEMIARHLTNEHPQTIALIVSYLIDPKKRALVVDGLPENLKADVTYRMAILGSVPPGVIREIEAVLQEELRKHQTHLSNDVGGIDPAAEMLKEMNTESSAGILKLIRESNPELADSIEKSMKKRAEKAES